MELSTALEWAATRHSAVLITIRRDGRPQSSDVVVAVREGVIRVSVTDDRAKTRNLRRDPRAVVHMSSPDSWSYVSFEGDVELSPVAEVAGDAACLELAQLLRDVQGEEHSDWDEFNQAMVDDKRLVVRFTPTKATGQVH
jgi:PPOX class probable F420-dependent enzyme